MSRINITFHARGEFHEYAWPAVPRVGEVVSISLVSMNGEMLPMRVHAVHWIHARNKDLMAHIELRDRDAP